MIYWPLLAVGVAAAIIASGVIWLRRHQAERALAADALHRLVGDPEQPWHSDQLDIPNNNDWGNVKEPIDP